MARILYECSDRDVAAGGVRRLYRHIEILASHGFDAAILHHRKGFRLTWLTSYAPVTYWEDALPFLESDFLVIPEGHGQIMSLSRTLPCKRVIIALNWSRIFQCLPPAVSWKTLGIDQVIAGGQYEDRFVRATMGVDTTVIPSGIDTKLFSPSAKKMQIAYMPRKNAREFQMIYRIFRTAFPEFHHIPFISIDGIPHTSVADHLAESAIFLAHTYPEGLSRKTLEAMACGCIVVGFTGLGSNECMHHLRNCLVAPDADILSFCSLLRYAIVLINNGEQGDIVAGALATAANYSLEREEQNVLTYWRHVLQADASAT